MRTTARLSILWLLAGVPAPAVAASAQGVVIEEVKPGFAADRAGLRAGDVLVAWERLARAPAAPDADHGALRSPFDVEAVEREQAPRGTVRLEGRRGGAVVQVELPVEDWKLELRPWLEGDDLAAYLEGASRLAGDERQRGALDLHDLAERLAARGRRLDAAWLLGKAAWSLAGHGSFAEAESSFAAAVRAAEAAGDPRAAALVADAQAQSLYGAARLGAALEAGQRALDLWRRVQVAPLSHASSMNKAAVYLWLLGRLEAARELLGEALAILEREAPESLPLAQVLNNLSSVSAQLGDDGSSSAFILRAYQMLERLAPEGYWMAATLSNLGSLEAPKGELAEAEAHFRRALAIEKRLRGRAGGAAIILINLSSLAEMRGDLVTAEDYAREALAIHERLGSENNFTAAVASSLAGLAVERGDLEEAERMGLRALAIQERVAPESPDLVERLSSLSTIALRLGRDRDAEAFYRRAASRLDRSPASLQAAQRHRNLARYKVERGEAEAAEGHLETALAIEDRVAPESLFSAQSWLLLGEISLARGDLGEAETRFLRALGIFRLQAAGSVHEAAAHHGLALMFRARDQSGRALGHFRSAAAALEAQSLRLRGEYEAWARYAARNVSVYRDYLDVLIEHGEHAEAFHVLERSRARAFLHLLGARELRFTADLPAELERELRRSNYAYDQALSALMVPSGTGGEAPEELAGRLDAARRRREEVLARVRLASPRLSALQRPSPLTVAGAQAALEPGTLLLAYAVHDHGGHLFALGPGEGELAVFALEAGEAALSEEVVRFRALLHPARDATAVRLLAARLSDTLLAPAAAALVRAERLVIVPDGPLHDLPFAALLEPGSGAELRYLVEAKPLSLAASATALAELGKRRHESREGLRVAAFGDPLYPRGPAGTQSDPVLRGVLAGGAELTPLPGTRREVEALRTLFPATSRIYIGEEATEEQVKSPGAETDVLHLACHGILDERFPLESALALTIPADSAGENGLLQAWEIFEQVRLDADLVTLSACDSARGRHLAGEGLVGLTAAFQYAGARSVLASLWVVGDRSTARLMERFYGHLKSGLALDEALRRAQVDLIRSTEPGLDTAHPFFWAAFQLNGDAR